MKASGADISRSAAGRVLSEAGWLPSMLCDDTVSWREVDNRVYASHNFFSEKTELELSIDDEGRAKSFKLPRWGNPDNTTFRPVDFGGFVDEERAFAGYVIPVRVRAGWYFGSDRFESEGEFFRATVDEAAYR